ncbi:MAG: phage portal protein [Porticoccaceae bacterium]|nr:phage portal protein [Porticoccaceae bacterium]
MDHDNALTYSAVFRAISYISAQIAVLPFDVYRQSANGSRQRVNNELRYLLHTRPNSEMSAFAFRETLMAWALSWGNGYAEIETGIGGEPVALWPISPDRVEVMRAPDGAIVYRISGKGDTVYIPAERMFHLHGLGFDGLVGYSVISMAARSIGIGMAAEEFGAAFFGNGSTLGGVLTMPGTLSDQAYERLKKDWEGRHVGPKSAHKPAILEEGMEWKSIGIPPGDAQFLETRKFQISDVARWYGLPPHKLADLDRATFSNIEHQSIEVVVDTLTPWAIRWEQEANYKLFGRRQGQYYSKLALNALMRGDSKSRAEFYREMANLGAFSVNEIRAFEDLDPIGAIGDKRLVQLNLTTLDKVGEESSLPASADPQNTSAINSHRIVIVDAIDRIARREQASYDGHKKYNADYHRKYIERDLKAPVLALFTALHASFDEATLNSVIAEYADYHLADSQAIIRRKHDLSAQQRGIDNAEILISMVTEALQDSA